MAVASAALPRLATPRLALRAFCAERGVPVRETGKVVVGGVFTRFFEVTAPSVNYDEIRVIVSWPEEGTTKAVTVFGRRNK